METHLPILRRAGKVLIVLGIIALAAELDSLTKAPKGFIPLNIAWLGYIIAGLLLVRGSLRAAAVISWLSALLLPICTACAAIQLLLTPFDFTLLQLRLTPGPLLQLLLWPIAIAVSLAGLLVQLRRQPVLDAGLRKHHARVPVLLGIAISVAACIFLSQAIRGESARRAKAAVAQKLGPNYKYWVRFMNFGAGPFGKVITASVMAYNHDGIRGVLVQWTEDRHGQASELTVALPNSELPLSGLEAWIIDGTTYRVESTTLLTCGNGERVLTVAAHVNYMPTSIHQPIAVLLARYAVEHGYAERALRAWSNPPPRAQLASVVVALIDPRSTPRQLMGFRYNIGFAELGNTVKGPTLATR